MKIGVFATFMSPIANTQMIMDFGRRAEDIGLDSVWLGEHVVLFNEMEFPYPGSPDGKILFRKAVVYWRRWQPLGCWLQLPPN